MIFSTPLHKVMVLHAVILYVDAYLMFFFLLFQPQIESGDKSMSLVLLLHHFMISLVVYVFIDFFFVAVIMPPSALDRLG